MFHEYLNIPNNKDTCFVMNVIQTISWGNVLNQVNIGSYSIKGFSWFQTVEELLWAWARVYCFNIYCLLFTIHPPEMSKWHIVWEYGYGSFPLSCYSYVGPNYPLRQTTWFELWLGCALEFKSQLNLKEFCYQTCQT